MKTLEFTNGDRMPILGLGTWKSRPGEVHLAVREAIRIGYRHIDCAAVYANETEVGHAIHDAIRDGEVAREDLWITSKLWCNAHGRDNVLPALRKTLQDLGLAYLDLYLVHWPVSLRPGVVYPRSGADVLRPEDAPLADTWAGMEDGVRAGLCRSIGVSNFSARKLADLLARCEIRPAMNQIELHPFLQQTELLGSCRTHGVHVTAYSPLGSTDRPTALKAPDEPSLLADPVIGSIAAAHGKTPAQVLLRWHVQREVAVIPKSVSPARLRENFAAAEVSLSPADMDRIAGLDRGYRFVPGTFWALPGSPWTVEALWA